MCVKIIKIKKKNCRKLFKFFVAKKQHSFVLILAISQSMIVNIALKSLAKKKKRKERQYRNGLSA